MAKLVISHAANELYGAQVFDEPAIAYAPTPYAKWLTCRVAMEEYGHHVRFKQLGVQMGIPEERMIPGTGKRPLSIFEFPLKTWEEFVAIKLLADLAEILQVEDLLHCTFHPLTNLARTTMPEERTCRRSSPARGRRTTRPSASGTSSGAPTTRCAPTSSSARPRLPPSTVSRCPKRPGRGLVRRPGGAAHRGRTRPSSMARPLGLAPLCIVQARDWLARAQDAASPFKSKFRLLAAGRWPLGVVGSTLALF